MRLIDADALHLGKFVEPRTDWHQGWNDALDAATTQAPTIEAEPVKHGEPLTIEELRQMHGKPVWIEEENTWGIVCVNESGNWKGIPFVVFFYKNVRCEWDIESRGLTCYRYKPVKHGRWWEGVEIKLDTHTGEYWEEVYYNCLECDYASDWNSPYCPNCGAKMGVTDTNVGDKEDNK